MSFPAALNLLKRDCEKKAKELPTFPLLRDSLSVTPVSERDALYTFIDKETIITRHGSRTIHRLYVYVPNCDSKCVGWVLNEDADNCMVCNRAFNLFLWKKHCRCCGNVICSNCVVDEEVIIIELSDLGEQMLCVQCYYGQEEVHAQCYIVGKNGLDKSYYPPPPVRRMNTGELSRRGTGEMSRRGTGELSRRGTGEFNQLDFSPARNPTPTHTPIKRVIAGTGAVRGGGYDGRKQQLEDAAAADMITPQAGFIIKTRVLTVSSGNTHSHGDDCLNVYINVTHHESIPRTSTSNTGASSTTGVKTAAVEPGSSPSSFSSSSAQELHYCPFIISTYKQYVRQTSADRAQKFIIFNIAVNSLHVLPLPKRSKTAADGAGAGAGKKSDEKGLEMMSRYERLCLFVLKQLENSFNNLLLSREISFPLINDQRNFIGPKGEKVRFHHNLLSAVSPRPMRPLGEGDSTAAPAAGGGGPGSSAVEAVWYNNNCVAASSELGSMHSIVSGSGASTDIRASASSVLCLNESTTTKVSEFKEQLEMCRELVVIFLPGVVMKSCCNRKNAVIGEGYSAAPKPDAQLYSPFCSPLASPMKNNGGSSKFFSEDVVALYQHRVFINICHNRHIPVSMASNSTRYIKKAPGAGLTDTENTIAIEHVLKLISNLDLFMLCNAPKLGTPSASAKESKDRTISRDFIIYDVAVSSIVFRAMQAYFAEFKPPSDAVRTEQDTSAEAASASESAVSAAALQQKEKEKETEENRLREEFLSKRTRINTYILAHICDKYGDAFSPACSYPKTKNNYKGNANDILPYVLKGDELEGCKQSIACNSRPIAMAAIPAFTPKASKVKAPVTAPAPAPAPVPPTTETAGVFTTPVKKAKPALNVDTTSQSPATTSAAVVEITSATAAVVVKDVPVATLVEDKVKKETETVDSESKAEIKTEIDKTEVEGQSEGDAASTAGVGDKSESGADTTTVAVNDGASATPNANDVVFESVAATKSASDGAPASTLATVDEHEPQSDKKSQPKKQQQQELTLAPDNDLADLTSSSAHSSSSSPPLPGSARLISKEKSNEIRAMLLRTSSTESRSSSSKENTSDSAFVPGSSPGGVRHLIRHGSEKAMIPGANAGASTGVGVGGVQRQGSKGDKVVLRRQSTRMASRDNPINSLLHHTPHGSPDGHFGASPGSSLGHGTSYVDAAVQDWLDLSDEYGGYNFHGKSPGQSHMGQSQMYRGLSLADSTSSGHGHTYHSDQLHQQSAMSKDDTISTIKDNLKNNRTFILPGETGGNNGSAAGGSGTSIGQQDTYMNGGGDIIYGHTTPWEMFMREGESLVATGLIGKRNKVGIIKQRQLILTDYPRLFYVDPKTMTVRGEVEWSDEEPPYALEVSRTTFELTTVGRTYRFIDIINGSEFWAEHIMEAVKRHEENQTRRSYVMR